MASMSPNHLRHPIPLGDDDRSPRWSLRTFAEEISPSLYSAPRLPKSYNRIWPRQNCFRKIKDKREMREETSNDELIMDDFRAKRNYVPSITTEPVSLQASESIELTMTYMMAHRIYANSPNTPVKIFPLLFPPS